MNKLILIDGNSLLFRAYFAMHPMVTADGQHTQGVFAFINMLNKIIKDYNPDYMAVAFDMKEKTFRHDMYPDYKAGRLKTPLELLSEIPLLHQVLEARNIKIVELPKYEADDLIGTIAAKASAEGIETLIITGDKDELQLIDENTRVLINKRGMSEFDLYDTEAMKARYNLTPKQFIDLKGLMGDKSDNIPGVAGVGEKKGIALLEEYGSLEDILANADNIKGKLGENVRASRDIAELSKTLATINTEAPIEFEWDELKLGEPDIDKLIDIYTRLEFNSFIKKLKAEGVSVDAHQASSEDGRKSLIFSSADIKELPFDKLISEAKTGEEAVISWDCDSNHINEPQIYGINILIPSLKAYSHCDISQISRDIILDALIAGEFKLIAYDIKDFLYSVMYYGARDFIPYHDILIAEYLIDPNRSNYDISKMLLKHCSYVIDDEETSPAEALINIYSIACEQRKFLEANGLLKLFEEIEMPLTETIVDMELEGIKVNKDILSEIGEEIASRIETLEQEIHDEAGHSFNINSPKQLANVLFEELKIHYPKQRSKNGGYSTAADVLELLSGSYTIVEKVLEYRKLSKLKGTYVDGLMPFVGEDYKIRPHFKQTVAATGRLSCTEPNLQNIPIRDEYGRSIRKAFITSADDRIFIGADYSQIELRIMAELSGDEVLIDAFNNDLDIHKLTASRVFDIPLDEVTALDRSKAKAVNFGVIYGMSGFGLSENLNISRAEAQSYINDYFEKHRKVKEYLDARIAEGEKNREVRTFCGRLRQIPEFASRKYMDRELAKRLAMNTPIQGTAADIIKIAMNSVHDALIEKGLKSRLILQIHDELITEGPASEADEVRKILNDCMCNAVDFNVELKCDIHSGTSWYELK